MPHLLSVAAAMDFDERPRPYFPPEPVYYSTHEIPSDEVLTEALPRGSPRLRWQTVCRSFSLFLAITGIALGIVVIVLDNENSSAGGVAVAAVSIVPLTHKKIVENCLSILPKNIIGALIDGFIIDNLVRDVLPRVSLYAGGSLDLLMAIATIAASVLIGTRQPDPRAVGAWKIISCTFVTTGTA